jgi:serine/threonine protein kinase/WD40 repeat protein
MSAADQTRNPVERLAEEFLERYRRGERPSIHEYTARYPALAEEIRELLPALVLMEEAGQEEAEPEGAFSGRVTGDGQALQRLGEYRILREIGRGGMGVVYEAVQETLGRHVALKVLPFEAAANPVHRQRFQREARAAARLHHTNIVPVFDVGEHKNIHYYAMQFIQGQALDEVLAELQRLRRPAEANASPARAATGLATSLAESLQSGQFALDDGPPQASEPVARSDDALEPAAPARASSYPAASGLSSASSRPYHRSVARIGQQVAEALAYAHAHKVLHRDIKPSNLLLDHQGTVWLTDFGLAKEEGEDLTRTGDVVGTLRYLAPERLGGKADVRGDIYSLGLTLYELATLRPAFAETDRVHLVQRITQVEPTPPRQLDPHLPRDLETIIQKAIAKEPPRRYQTAAELAADLGRFLEDRPILARRNSLAALAWRWIRRNPGWAATLGLVLGLLVVLAVGGLLVNMHLRAAVENARQAEQDKTEQLWQTLVERAAAKRASGQMGQRFETLAAIKKAAAIRPGPELRDEAVAALVLPDLELAREWQGCTADTLAVAFDVAFTRYVTLQRDGSLVVYRLEDAGARIIAHLPSLGSPPFHGLAMSPDGRFVAYGHTCHQEGSASGLRLWKLDEPEPAVVLDDPDGVHLFALVFHPSGRWLAVGHGNGTVSIYEPQTGRTLRRFDLGIAPYNLAFHPQEQKLAVIAGNTVRLFEIDSGRERPGLPAPAGCNYLSGLAWHPDGRHLATVGNDFKIRLYDAGTCREVMAPWSGEKDGGTLIAFNHAGDRLVSFGWGGQSRLWEVDTGRVLLTLPGSYGLQFSPDDRLLGSQVDGPWLRLWRLAPGRELRALRRAAAAESESIFAPQLDATGQWLAAYCRDKETRLGFLGLDAGLPAPSTLLPFAQAERICGYFPQDGWLTQGETGFLSWPMQRDPRDADALVIGPPQRQRLPRGAQAARASPDGSLLAVPYWTGTLVLDRTRPGWQLELGPQHDVRHCAVSPDKRWIATASWFWDGRSQGVRVWDAHTGELVRELPLDTMTLVAFSPDGKWLATFLGRQDGRLWEVGTWRERLHLRGGGILFSPDSKMLALMEPAGAIALVESDTGRVLARLNGPETALYQPQAFTPDGTRLITTNSTSPYLQVWDLRTLRKELVKLGLDWDWPPFPEPAAPSGSVPSRVRIDGGFLAQPFVGPAAEAVAVYSLALAAAPFNADLYFYRALAEAQLRQNRVAIADYSRFLALTAAGHPHRVEALVRRIGNHRTLGDPTVALTELELLLQGPLATHDWDDEIALSCDTVARQFVASNAGSALAARLLPLARWAREHEPYSAEHQHTLGAVLYRLGRYAEALPCLSCARPDGRSRPFEGCFLAMCYQQLGQHEKARQCLERANGEPPAFSLWPADPSVDLGALRAEASRVVGLSAAPR